MKIEGNGKLLRIFLGELDKYDGKPLYEVIVRKARELNLAGATVFRGLEGFGAKSVIHKAKFLELSEDLPILIEIVDSEDKIAEAIPVFDELITNADCGVLITIEKAEVIKYTHGK
jgi:PII-like signaling protein